MGGTWLPEPGCLATSKDGLKHCCGQDSHVTSCAILHSKPTLSQAPTALAKAAPSQAPSCWFCPDVRNLPLPPHVLVTQGNNASYRGVRCRARGLLALARQWSINHGLSAESRLQLQPKSCSSHDTAAIMSNLTLPLPPGSSNHGNPNLLCIPPRWFDYLLFYLSNYLAHAATVIKTPGQGRKEMIYNFLAALLLPGSGNMRAMEAIRRHSWLESDPIKRALRAGALCMVVRLGHDQNAEANPRSLEEGRIEVLQSKGEQPNTQNNPTEAKDADQAQEADIVDTPTEAKDTDQAPEADIVPVDTVTSAPRSRASESRER